MTHLDSVYARLLQLGFLVLRQAIDSKDDAWIAAEMDLLHNIPSLIGEENLHRHRYFWEKERTHYLERVAQTPREEARSRMRTYYEPLWLEMKPLVDELFAPSNKQAVI